MSKSPKFAPVLISSKDGLTATVNAVVRDKLKAAALNVQMEQEIAAIQKRYQSRLEPLLRDIQAGEAGIQVYATRHRDTLFPKGVQSLDLQLAVIGFRNTPRRVEKCRSKDTFGEIALRLAAYREYGEAESAFDEPPVTFNGEDYVRYPDPELNKQALLADREKLPASALKAAGIKFDFDELFYFEPKSEVIEGIKEVAA